MDVLIGLAVLPFALYGLGVLLKISIIVIAIIIAICIQYKSGCLTAIIVFGAVFVAMLLTFYLAEL